MIQCYESNFSYFMSFQPEQESRQFKNDFDRVNKLYNEKLDNQRKFRERTEKALGAAQKIKISLTMRLRDVEGWLISIFVSAPSPSPSSIFIDEVLPNSI